MNIIQAADNTFRHINDIEPERSEHGRGIAHAGWMLMQILDNEVSGDKAQRWLGYAQGIIVENYYADLEQMRECNV